ncbi:TetR/AcrR family transcriptional regulator [Streptomyces sp. MAR4 CNX-425]|uniref:TetR/AcrR family transcriptional regulator n=1 Tax=Streptomyces sp. MAR4 CNX-425 TaxID=3406343 RepID=UPI003B50D870
MARSDARGTRTGRARTRMGTEERRRQLLRIGAELFAERPFDDVWIEEVAERAGVSRGLLYHYFPTKRQFYAAVVRHEGERLLRMTEPDPATPVDQQVQRGLEAYLEYAEEHALGLRAFHRASAAGDREIREIHEHLLAEQKRRMVTVLDAQAAAGLLDGTTPAALRLAVHGWLAFVTAAVLDWLERGEPTRAEVQEVCTRALLGALSGALGD